MFFEKCPRTRRLGAELWLNSPAIILPRCHQVQHSLLLTRCPWPVNPNVSAADASVEKLLSLSGVIHVPEMENPVFLGIGEEIVCLPIQFGFEIRGINRLQYERSRSGIGQRF